MLKAPHPPQSGTLSLQGGRGAKYIHLALLPSGEKVPEGRMRGLECKSDLSRQGERGQPFHITPSHVLTGQGWGRINVFNLRSSAQFRKPYPCIWTVAVKESWLWRLGC